MIKQHNNDKKYQKGEELMVKKHVLDNVFCNKNSNLAAYNRTIISVNIVKDISEPIQVDCLIDRGSSENFIDINVAKKLKLLPSPLDIPFSIESIDGNMLSTTGINHAYNDIKISIGNGHTETINLHPIQSVHGHVILGMPWLKKHNPSINWDTFDILFNSGYCLNNCVHHKKPVDIMYQPEVPSEDDKSDQNNDNSDQISENIDQNSIKSDDSSSYFGQNSTSESDTEHANTIMSKLKSYLFNSGQNVAQKGINTKNKVKNIVKKKLSREKNKVSEAVQTDDYSNYGYLLDHEMFSTPLTDSADVNEQKQVNIEESTNKNSNNSNKYDIEFDENMTSNELNKLVQQMYLQNIKEIKEKYNLSDSEDEEQKIINITKKNQSIIFHGKSDNNEFKNGKMKENIEDNTTKPACAAENSLDINSNTNRDSIVSVTTDIYQRINTKNLRKNSKNYENSEQNKTKNELKNNNETSIEPQTTQVDSNTFTPTTELQHLKILTLMQSYTQYQHLLLIL
ncbi:hypothetical protein AX774_g3012 [Zancudomyces culisetae]|uniref:Uncharacterized protein n=1 Tax=Zancudomyces culisetae TaxID=1213189 RepID=A0A1R1PRH1_ZANCU|nr:hypothetical protein AX774_g3012 [Zancudomyces culisetae]|eukprot:OMH83482.1 hypothetical protein AX774_g3012 [Zancudomyces culisetae]